MMFFVGTAIFAKAQQDPLYTQFMNQLLSINPAYAGAKGVTSATLLLNRQFVSGTYQYDGFEDPTTATFFLHKPWGDQNGIGGSIVYDVFGYEKWYGFYGDYSFTISYPGNKNLALGLKAGISSLFVNFSQYADLRTTVENDVAFTDDIRKPFMPNFGVGMYYSTPKGYIGLSIPKLISNKFVGDGVEITSASREQIHLFFMGGYVFDVNRIIKFKPYFMTRATMNAPISLDLTADFVMVDMFWVGATYRVGNGIGARVQLQLNEQIRFGVAYDLRTSEYKRVNTGLMEVMLTYDFSFSQGRVRSPRYF